MKTVFSDCLLRELSSLPSRHAILLGWVSELPVLMRMNQLSEHYRPKSDDSDFWAVWSGQNSNSQTVDRQLDWKVVAGDWQQVNTSVKEQNSENNNE